MPKSSVTTKGKAPGDGHVQSQRTAIAIWGRKDRQCVHASALLCAFQSTIGQKERMPRRLVPRIQFQPATVLMRQSLRRDDQGCKKTRNFCGNELTSWQRPAKPHSTGVKHMK